MSSVGMRFVYKGNIRIEIAFDNTEPIKKIPDDFINLIKEDSLFFIGNQHPLNKLI